MHSASNRRDDSTSGVLLPSGGENPALSSSSSPPVFPPEQRLVGQGHARSMSHVGILRTPSSSVDSHHLPGRVATSGNTTRPTSSCVKGHQRALSHGQVNESKAHKRVGSRTDFILPVGHEHRERERESRPVKTSIKKQLGHSREASRTESVYTIRDKKRSLLERLCFWKKHENETTRLVVPNTVVALHMAQSANPNNRYPTNKIRTAKYTLFSFLPKNLLEQFHRWANLYFLSIVLLNFVPAVNAFVKELAVFPLIFVLGVTALKDAFEDRRRHHSDARVNGRICKVFSNVQGHYESLTWDKVRVGDVVQLSCNEILPADMVLLNASNEQGVCYIESSNLDGETNLKQRQCIRGIVSDVCEFDVSKFDSVLEVGPPSTKFNHFVGSVLIQEGEIIPLTSDNLLLRDCVVKNTDFIEGIVVYTGHETKALLNNGGSRYKRSKLEQMMNREVVWCILILFLMALLSSTGTALWQRKYNEKYHLGVLPFLPHHSSSSDLPRVEKSPLMVAFTSFWTFIILYQVLIPISLYVTIEIVKMMQVYHIQHDPHFKDKKSQSTIRCQALNITEELGQVGHIFTDKTGTLTENDMVFQRCSINGIDYNHVPYTSCNNKALSRDSFSLNSRLLEALKVVELHHLYQQSFRAGTSRRVQSRMGTSLQYQELQRLSDFFFTLAACNTVVVTKCRRNDQMNEIATVTPEESSRNDLAADSDKRPTLSVSEIKRCLFRSVLPQPRSLSPIPPSPPTTPSTSPIQQNVSLSLPRRASLVAPQFPLKKISSLTEITMNTFTTDADEGPQQKGLPRPTLLPLNKGLETSELKKPPIPRYEAESPDELALVAAALRYGCCLLRRDLHSVVVSLPGLGTQEYKVLNVLPFDSTRKCMSLIVQLPDTGEKVLYCKGADSAILSNLTNRMDEATQLLRCRTENHLQLFSRKGLRVLCMAKRVLSDTEYEDWATQHRKVEASLANRDKKLRQSFSKIERDMQLIGATGIEDRLQDYVPETISTLRNAGIKVWVLTGDKQETAINIAYSCALFTPGMEIFKLNAHSKEETERTLGDYLQQIEDELEAQHGRNSHSSSRHTDHEPSQNSRRMSFAHPQEKGLVVDGKTLVFILDRRTQLKDAFLRLSSLCNAVMCCRVNPLQKALVVRVAKEKLNTITLAVGDGANDVSMIQTADVGIGISGVEGQQAVMASDFAVTRFHHLKRLLLVHGHWCYDRLAKIILFFFYKNASFVFLLMWYQILCGFSTSVMIDDLYLVMFNLLFTSLPPLAIGIYDKDASEELLLSQPHLYGKTRLGTVYNHRSFWINIIDAIYQSAVIFFVGVIAYNHSDAGVYEFGMTITHSCLLTQLLHISIETKSWTVLHVGAILLSYFVFFAFGVLYTVACNGCLGIPSMYGELANAVTSLRHWSCVLLAVVTSLLPRFVSRAMQATLWCDDVTMSVKEHKMARNSQFAMSRASSEISVPSAKIEEEDDSRNVGEEDFNNTISSMVTMTTIASSLNESVLRQDI